MKLYYAPGVCSLAVHIALNELDATYDLEKVDLATKETETGQNFSKVNPLGYVPALEIDGSDILLEAPVILQYLADTHPDAKLAPPAGTRDRLRLQESLNFTASELHKSFGPFFAAVKPEGALEEQAMKKLKSRFDRLNGMLSDGRAYVMGDDFSVADAYTFVVANWAGVIDLDLSPWPYVQAYVARVGARPKVQAAMKREGLIN